MLPPLFFLLLLASCISLLCSSSEPSVLRVFPNFPFTTPCNRADGISWVPVPFVFHTVLISVKLAHTFSLSVKSRGVNTSALDTVHSSDPQPSGKTRTPLSSVSLFIIIHTHVYKALGTCQVCHGQNHDRDKALSLWVYNFVMGAGRKTISKLQEEHISIVYCD